MRLSPRASPTRGQVCGKYSRVSALVTLVAADLAAAGAGSGRAGCCLVRVAGELMNRNGRVAVTAGTVAVRQAAGAAGADAVREQHVAVTVLARRGAGVERGRQ